MKKLLCLFLFLLTLMLTSGCGTKIIADKESNIGPDMKMQMNGVTFSIDKAEKLKEVKPMKPSGYYNYYEEKEGYAYFVVTGKAENKGPNNLEADNIIVRGFLDHTEYEGKLIFSNSDESDLVKKLGKDMKQTFYFILLVKDQQAVPDTIEFFYNNNFKEIQKKDHYDNSIRWTIPS